MAAPFRLATPTPPAMTRRWVRELDRRAIEDLGVPGLLLMENAGRGAAELAAELLAEAGRPRGPVTVLCGKGNNGGDGLVVARLLHARGVAVRALLAFDADSPGDATGDAAVNLAAAQACGVPIGRPETGDRAALRRVLAGDDPALLIDALLGTGVAGSLRAPYASLVAALDDVGVRAGRPVLAIDCPSGLDVDTGEVLGVAVRATATATFGAPKRGFTLDDGPAYVGRLEVIDISLPPALVAEVVAEARAAGGCS